MSADAGPAAGPVAVRRLIGVSLNSSIDKMATVDRLVPGTIHRPVVRSVVPGGKPANVVRAARRLGLDGELVAVLGGHAGRWFRDALAERSIGLHEIPVDGETRTCLSVLDEASGELTEFYEAGVPLEAADWPRVEAALGAAIGPGGGGTIIVLSGSLPPGAPIDGYARLARIAAGRGARAVVDAEGDVLRAALETAPWLVKVNAREAESVTGTSARTRDRAAAAARALQALGAENAVVTRGVHGAVLAERGGRAWTLGAVPAAHRGPYSVGSGDAFTAGLLAAMARGATMPDALCLAGAAGAASARLPGQGELDPADVERTRLTCAVTRLDPA